ncbi:MAG TPA: chorismate pyruvate-lyase family protein [Solirubrobacteraceae bacterium]|nr:chorismate pyruvate-lyase family protein [Solirubrobacteraceae bacterium]
MSPAGGNGSGDSARQMVQRLIFNTDATVVRILENCFDERIRTAGLVQAITQEAATDVDLELAGGEGVLRRSTLLQGCRTGRNYIYAESDIVLDRLPPSLREGLVETTEPIGRLLIRDRVETFRELLRSGRSLAGPRGPALGAQSDQMLPFRTYRVIVGGHPVMRITEHFAPVFLAAGPLRDTVDVPVSDVRP